VAHGSGLPGAVVQRSLADWPVVLAAGLLLVCATTLLATGVVYGDAVASGGLHRSILAAPPSTRGVEVALSSEPAAIDGLDAAIRPTIQASIAATGGEIARVVRTGSFADPAIAPDQVHDLTTFTSFDGRTSCRAASSSGWQSPGLWRTGPGSSSPTSRPASSTRRPGT